MWLRIVSGMNGQMSRVHTVLVKNDVYSTFASQARRSSAIDKVVISMYELFQCSEVLLIDDSRVDLHRNKQTYTINYHMVLPRLTLDNLHYLNWKNM